MYENKKSIRLHLDNSNCCRNDYWIPLCERRYAPIGPRISYWPTHPDRRHINCKGTKRMMATVLILIAGMLKGLMDTISHHWEDCIFNTPRFKKYHDWMNPIWSWDNKYFDNDPKKGYKTLMFGIPKPVLMSDLWHLAQSIMLLCISFALGLTLLESSKILPFLILSLFLPYDPTWYVMLYAIWFRLWFGVGFQIMYKYFLLKK